MKHSLQFCEVFRIFNLRNISHVNKKTIIYIVILFLFFNYFIIL